MSAALRNLRIYQGDTYTHTITLEEPENPEDPEDEWVWVPKDITDLTFRAQVRKKAGGTLLATFAVATLDAEGGVLQISLTSAQTALIRQIAAWDLQSYDPSANGPDPVQTWLYGAVRPTAEVTLNG